MACSKPDASYVTSPSMIALVGTAEGEVEFFPGDEPPAPVEPPSGWKLDAGNARFEALENFEPSIQIVALLVTRAAARMDVWLAGDNGSVFRWSAGPAEPYSGTLCFQFALTDGDAAVPLERGVQYRVVLAFLDDAGTPVAARSIRVAGSVPEDLEDPLPGPGSHSVYQALACPRAPL